MKDFNVALILLAAGSSTRLGESGPKQLLDYHGKTLLRHAGETAATTSCSPLIAVTGFASDITARELEGLSIRTIYNPEWPDGMGTSIKAGILAISDQLDGLDGIIIMLCDQPLLTGTVIDSLIAKASETGAKLVVSEYGDTTGVPAFFSKTLFGELLKIPDAEGARGLIKKYQSEAEKVPFSDGAVDIDTLKDYYALV